MREERAFLGNKGNATLMCWDPCLVISYDNTIDENRTMLWALKPRDDA
jgi:hypothetical protein